MSELEKKLVEETFSNPFDEIQFKKFLTDLLKTEIKAVKNITQYIKRGDVYSDYIESIYTYGNYKDKNQDTLNVYVVKLKNTKLTSLERARTMQRNLIANFLKKSVDNRALVAFYYDNSNNNEINKCDWRFSFIKIEYDLDENGNINSKLPSAKRHSFLVGPTEPNHTCKKQVLSLLESNEFNIDKIEESFNVENATKEFFNEYRDLFKDLKKSLDEIIKKDEKVKNEFESKNINSSDFAKKLLGQIVFLYFLQKKGWLGVEEEKNWGEGPKNFMRKLFNKEYIKYDNFFNDVIEPLFYKGLSEDVEDFHYETFNCKIPFLNGGLFENINGYNWRDTDILIDNKIFKKIFNTFDTYNFTIKEDEPLEKEVAIDPEMLGKVFEDLLERENRNEKGTFYTPRYIVNYICQESLISYLDSKLLNVPKEEVAILIKNGSSALDSIFKNLEEAKKYNGRTYEPIRLPNSIVKNKEIIEDLLKKVKIIDPAVGSGAFPISMMNEIVKARYILALLQGNTYITNYELKKETIENSLYGVDIDYSATDITKLRFWLSLIVDEDIIEPLPNLDNKIMCGNSLIDEFKGIKIFKDNLNIKKSGQTLLNNTSTYKFQLLADKKTKFFNAGNIHKKLSLKKDIERLKWEFIEESLKESVEFSEYPEIKNELQKIESFESKPFFVWNLEFSEIFHGENPGFDIVIGNPPYVSTKGVTKEDKKIYKKIYGINDDLYNYFFLKSFDLLKKDGILGFITSDTYLTLNSKINLRNLFQNNKIIEIIKVDNVFESAKVSPAIIIFQKEKINQNYNLIFKDAVKSFKNPEIYKPFISIYKEAPFKAFFIPNDINMQSFEKYHDNINKLLNRWYEKINTSKKIEKNKRELYEYREKLVSNDLTLLGLVTEGGQGLATANNGKFVGVLDGTSNAERIKKTRIEKFSKAINKYSIKEYAFIKNKKDAENFLNDKDEKEIREIFDSLKEKYDRDIFGQGYIFRIISKDEISNPNNLTDKEKTEGIEKTKPTYVLYDKGDKEGNKWYLETPFYIDWSKDNVSFLKNNSGKTGKGMPVVRNPNFYFKEGICWSDVHTTYIKARLKSNGVYDVKSMSLFSVYSNIPDWYIISLLNSKYISEYIEDFINNTVSFQINDARIVPIVVPTNEQLIEFKDIFDKAMKIKKEYFSKKISEEDADIRLINIQNCLDEYVYKLYGITV